LTIIKF